MIYSLNQKSVIMIRIVAVGISIITIIMMVSCNSFSKFYKSGKVLREYSSYYINDSLQFSYSFAGDYYEVKDVRIVKKTIKDYNLNFKINNCLGFFKTDDDPFLEHFIFYTPIERKNPEPILSKPQEDLIIDNKNKTITKIIHIPDKGQVYLVATSSEKFFKNLQNEYYDVFNTIKIGKGYDTVEFSAPFTLANQIFLDVDSIACYLLPILKLEECKQNYENSHQSNTYNQALATFCSFISNRDVQLKELIKKWRNENYMSKRDDSDVRIARSEMDAIQHLINVSRKEQVVMFNENHFSPNHRMLVHLLLKDLYDGGFRYLALEGLWEQDSLLSNRKFTISNSGFYTREPNMSNLIREALSLGYHVFGYDDFSKDREINQAINIFDNSIKTDSSAKVLVLAGFGHISERISERKNMMAREFYNLYGIDPLTIDQCEYLIDGDVELGIIDTLHVRSKKKLQADIYISNQLNYKTFAKLMNYKSVEFSMDGSDSIDTKKRISPFILSIYNRLEYEADEKATPIFNYQLEHMEIKKLQLLLPASEYTFVVRNNYNLILIEKQISD